MATHKEEMIKTAIKMRKVSADLSEIQSVIRDKRIREFIQFLHERASQIEEDFHK